MVNQEQSVPLASGKFSKYEQRNRRDRWLLSLTVLLILAAWGYGYLTAGTQVAPLVQNVIPGAATVQTQGQLFVGLDAQGQVIGYAAVGQAPGYGGPIETLVGVDPAGRILGVEVVSRRESPGFFRLLEKRDLIGQFAQHTVSDPLQIGQDLDAITGATISAEGVANSVRRAARHIAADGLNVSLPPEQRPIEWGWPEVTLVMLFASGYIGHRLRRPVLKRRIRWVTLLTGMVVLGFIYTIPLTITMVISLLSGYWPDWRTNLYWYMLIGGIIFVTSVNGKNPYCGWFCPFGAFQECLAAVSGAKLYRPRELNMPLKWVQRGLALAAIVFGLAFRQPGAAGYEPFATLFDLQGTTVRWALLVIVILAGLMMYRPFCNYLCPLDPVVDFVGVGRRWLKEGWSRWRTKTAKA